MSVLIGVLCIVQISPAREFKLQEPQREYFSCSHIADTAAHDRQGTDFVVYPLLWCFFCNQSSAK